MSTEFVYTHFFNYELLVLNHYYLLDFTSKFKPLFVLLFIIVRVFVIYFTFFQIIAAFYFIEDLWVFFQIFVFAVGSLIVLFKEVFITYYGKQFRRLYIDITRDSFYQPKTNEVIIICKKTLAFYNYIRTAVIYASVFCLIFAIVIMTTDTKYNLPITLWYPVDISEYTELVRIGQSIAFFHLIVTFFLNELIFGGFITFICLQYDLLCCNLENIDDELVPPIEKFVQWHRDIIR